AVVAGRRGGAMSKFKITLDGGGIITVGIKSAERFDALRQVVLEAVVADQADQHSGADPAQIEEKEAPMDVYASWVEWQRQRDNWKANTSAARRCPACHRVIASERACPYCVKELDE